MSTKFVIYWKSQNRYFENIDIGLGPHWTEHKSEAYKFRTREAALDRMKTLLDPNDLEIVAVD